MFSLRTTRAEPRSILQRRAALIPLWSVCVRGVPIPTSRITMARPLLTPQMTNLLPTGGDRPYPWSLDHLEVYLLERIFFTCETVFHPTLFDTYFMHPSAKGFPKGGSKYATKSGELDLLVGKFPWKTGFYVVTLFEEKHAVSVLSQAT